MPSGSRPDGQRAVTERSPPLGIQAIAVLGILVAVVSMFFEVGVILGDGSRAGVAIVSLALSVVQIAVLLGLIELKPWAWPAAVVLFILGTIVEFVQGNVGSSLISAVILGYIYVQKPLFQPGRIEGTT